MSAIKIEQTRVEITTVTFTVDIPEWDEAEEYDRSQRFDDTAVWADQVIIQLARQQMSREQKAALEGILAGAQLIKTTVSPVIFNNQATVTMQFEAELPTPDLAQKA